jgi:hypothetical protein
VIPAYSIVVIFLLTHYKRRERGEDLGTCSLNLVDYIFCSIIG